MPKPQIQILVCTNERPPETAKPSCGLRGSMEVYHRFHARVSAYVWLLVDAYPWFQEEPASGPAGWAIQAEVRPSPE